MKEEFITPRFWEWKTKTEQWLEEHIDRLDWYQVSKTVTLSEQFIEKYKDKVHWTMISSNQNLSIPFIIKHIDEVDWEEISCHQKCLTEEFVREYIEYIDWYYLCQNRDFNPSIQFIREFRFECVRVNNFFHHKQIEEKKFEQFLNFNPKYYMMINKSKMSKNDMQFSVQFLLKWFERMDWYGVSGTHTWTPEEMELLKHYINWGCYVGNHTNQLSPQVLDQFGEFLDWDCVAIYQKIPKWLKLKYKDKSYIGKSWR